MWEKRESLSAVASCICYQGLINSANFLIERLLPTIDAELRRALKNMPKWNMNGFIGAEFRLTYTLRIQ